MAQRLNVCSIYNIGKTHVILQLRFEQLTIHIPRMHSQICQFPSRTLYASKLISHQSVRSHLLKDLPNASAFTSSEDEDTIKEILGVPVIFFDTSGCEYFERLDGDSDEGSRCNENEAAVVTKWVEKLVGTGLLPSQIALITP
jgi:DNA polymerase alpha-associated DNA helicase A